MNYLVSVIVPCYQQGEYLQETLYSILNQTYQNWECIVVNDGSTDNTKEVTESFCNKDPRFRYVEQKNQGPSIARNTGINASQGEFILPLDADDIIAPTYMSKAMDCFEKHPDTQIVYCKARFFGAIEQEWELPKYSYESFIWLNSIFCSAFFRRSDFDKTIGYNPNMVYGFEDWDLWLSILTPNSIVYQIDEPLFFYRQKDLSRSTTSLENLKKLYPIIYQNHKEIYKPYLSHIIEYHNASLLYEIEAHNAILKVKASKSYRLGYALLHPIYKLLNLFRKNHDE